MDRPNRTVNISIGIQNSMGAALTPNMLCSQPHWKMATMAPYAAPMDSRFMTTAFRATMTERNKVISSRNDSSTTAVTIQGRRWPIWPEPSTAMAVSPPTCTVRLRLEIWLRMRWTSSAVALAWGALWGMRVTTAALRAGLSWTADAYATSGSAFTACTRPWMLVV